VAVSRLKLGVDVLLLVDLIDKRMEAKAIGPVLIDEEHRNGVDAVLERTALRKVNCTILEAASVSLTNLDTVNL